MKPGASAQHIESIGGSQYLVERSADGNRIESIQWKTLDGVAMSIGAPVGGFDLSTAVGIIQHLQ